MSLGRVILFAVDLHRMRDFYRDGIGLTPLEDTEGWVRFDAGGVELAVHAIPPDIARDIEISDPPRPRSDAAVKLVFDVDDLDAIRVRLRGHRAQLFEPVTSGDRRRCDAIDVEGNVFQISGPAD
jgi:catechol 2,3-dioxygenase-like lactoylglutathione lyase family enzyme